MLAFAYMSDGWDLVAIRSLDDGLASIVDAKKQVFFFDDFLGKIALDSRALAAKDSDLIKFISRVRKSPNARFILTTRAYILEEARRVSEHMADQKVEVSKYVLDVGVYTRRIRARILYNHLLVAGTPIEHIRALVGSGQIAKIIDHKNYNPRIIEWMTDPARLSEIGPAQYVEAFLRTLDNPEGLWDIAFRTHIPERCRHLLYCQHFSSEYGVDVEDLQRAFESVHPALSRRYGIAFGPDDFVDAFKILEGGFLHIRERTVHFVNPSLRDYMAKATDSSELLVELARAAPTAKWAQAVWKRLFLPTTPDELRTFATAFETVASKFPSLPGWRRSRQSPNSSTRCDLDTPDRIQLLLEWWGQSSEQRFADLALEVARHPSDRTAPWEARWFVDLIEKLRDPDEYGDVPGAEAIVVALEDDLVSVLGGGMASDDLETLADEIESHEAILSDDVKEALTAAIVREVEETEAALDALDSESEVDEYMRVLKKLAPRAHVSEHSLENAVQSAAVRVAIIEDSTEVASEPAFSSPPTRTAEVFDDAALRALFDPLVAEAG